MNLISLGQLSLKIICNMCHLNIQIKLDALYRTQTPTQKLLKSHEYILGFFTIWNCLNFCFLPFIRTIKVTIWDSFLVLSLEFKIALEFHLWYYFLRFPASDIKIQFTNDSHFWTVSTKGKYFSFAHVNTVVYKKWE